MELVTKGSMMACRAFPHALRKVRRGSFRRSTSLSPLHQGAWNAWQMVRRYLVVRLEHIAGIGNVREEDKVQKDSGLACV